MKYLSLLFITLSFAACSSPEPASVDASFQFEIIGNVTGGEGETIALIPDNAELHQRLTAPIVDGKFRFTGSSEYVQTATLRFEEDITGNATEYSKAFLLLEPGEVELTVNIEQRDDQFHFGPVTTRKGESNLAFWSFYEDFELASEGGGWVFGDSVRNDSMVRLVYPESRRKAFDVFDDNFYSGLHGLNAMMLHDLVLNQVNNRGQFNRGLMSAGQKDKLLAYFTALDSTQVDSNKYVTMREVVKHIHEDVHPVSFHELALYAPDGSPVRLSDRMQGHKNTVLYFWFSGCSPCRSFNQRMKDDYAKLKEKGIEIISINTDRTQEEWAKSSAADGIAWTNLYVKPGTGYEEKYGIRGYPAKFAFDEHLEFVNVNLREYHEVMDWVNSL